jgi:hypothetical protein
MWIALMKVVGAESGVMVPENIKQAKSPLKQIELEIPPGGIDWEVGDVIVNTTPPATKVGKRNRIGKSLFIRIEVLYCPTANSTLSLIA